MAKKVSKVSKVALENKVEKSILDTKESINFKFENAPFHQDGEVVEITPELAKIFIDKSYGKVHYE